jgi:hypothetical protein
MLVDRQSARMQRLSAHARRLSIFSAINDESGLATSCSCGLSSCRAAVFHNDNKNVSLKTVVGPLEPASMPAEKGQKEDVYVESRSLSAVVAFKMHLNDERFRQRVAKSCRRFHLISIYTSWRLA